MKGSFTRQNIPHTEQRMLNKNMLLTIPVLVVVQNSFVEVEGWQKQEKGAVQGRRLPLRREIGGKKDISKGYLPKKKPYIMQGQLLSPVSIQGMGQGLGQTWVPLLAVVACSFHVLLWFCIRVALSCQPF